MINFSVYFDRHFQVFTDSRKETLDDAFRLRYQVYCLEKGFEKREAFIDRKERDEFDAQSLHGIVRHRDSDTTMATVRLVRPNAEAAACDFPLEQSYPDLLTRHGITEDMLPRATSAEISRFAISKDCQSRMRELPATEDGDQATRAPGWRFNGRRYPLVTFGLFVALMRLSAQHGITHWLAVMEPSLLRLLSRFGIQFTPIGGVIDYHGRRQPCYGRVNRVCRRVHGIESDLCELVKRDLATSGTQQPAVPTMRHQQCAGYG